MIKVSGTHTVNASKNTVWKIISEIDGIHKWHPKVLHSPLVGKQATGEGAGRRCEFHDGTSVVETVIGWNEGHDITFELSEMAMPIKVARATMTVQENSDNSTGVTFAMQFEPKYGMFGHLMGHLIMKPMMKNVFKQVIKGLDFYVTNGEIVSAGA